MTLSGSLSLVLVALIILVGNTRGPGALVSSLAIIAISLAGASLWNSLTAPPPNPNIAAPLLFAATTTLMSTLRPAWVPISAPWIAFALTWLYLDLAALQSRQSLPQFTDYLRDGTWLYPILAASGTMLAKLFRSFGSGGGT